MLRDARITVEAALNLNPLKGAKIIAGEKGTGKKIIKVNIMEVPDIIDWVVEGELILTTAYSIKDNLKALKELIPKLHKKKVAGLAIKPGRYLDVIPEYMIDTANKLNFPLIELPYEASFSDIINPIMTEIINNQASLLKNLEEAHKQLMGILLEEGDLKDIGKALTRLVNNPVVIKDVIFTNTYISLPNENPDLEEELIKKADQQQTISSRYYQLQHHHIGEDIIKNKRVNKLTMPIVAGNKTYGYIIVWEMDSKLEVFDILTIENSSAIGALIIMKDLSIMEVEKRHKREFLEDLLSSDPNLQKSAIERGQIFGLEFGKDNTIMIISLDDIGDIYKKTPNNEEFIQQYKNNIRRIVKNSAKELNQQIIMGDKSDSIIILLAVDHMSEAKKVKEITTTLGKRVIEKAQTILPNISISIGIGRYYPRMEDLNKSYEDAKKSITLGKLFKKESIIHFDDLGIYRLLYYENLKPELIRFYSETLKPLVEYDRKKDTELVKTLESYFENGGNLKSISKELFTHYNTILYRIQRIEEICDLNLQNPQDRLNLEIALKIMGIISEKL